MGLGAGRQRSLDQAARHAGLMVASPGAQLAPAPLEAGREGCTPASGTMFVGFGVGAAGRAEKQRLGSTKAPLPRGSWREPSSV